MPVVRHRRADDEPARRGVVGDHVGHREAVVAVAGVEHLDADRDARGRREHVGRGDVRPGEVAAEHEHDLGLAPRLDQRGRVERLAEVERVRAFEEAVDRAGHAHLRLLGPAGDPQLPADERARGRRAAPAARRSRWPGRARPSGVDRGAVGDRLLEPRGELVSSVISPTRTVIGPSRSNSARKTSPGVMGTAACSAPVMIRWPGSSATPSPPSTLASHATTATRVAQRRRARAGVDELAVAGERHPDEPGVEVGDRDDPAGGRHRAVGGEVGDGVGELDPPVGDARVDDLHRRDGARDRGVRLRHRDAGPQQPLAEHEHDLGLDLGRDEPADGDRVAVAVDGGREDRAVVGGVDADHLLHRLAGQTRPCSRRCGRRRRAGARSARAGWRSRRPCPASGSASVNGGIGTRVRRAS